MILIVTVRKPLVVRLGKSQKKRKNLAQESRLKKSQKKRKYQATVRNKETKLKESEETFPIKKNNLANNNHCDRTEYVEFREIALGLNDKYFTLN